MTCYHCVTHDDAERMIHYALENRMQSLMRYSSPRLATDTAKVFH